MFTAEQIKTAHGKVKSGADFPAYVQDLKGLGVIHYRTFVADGHTDFFGANEYKASLPAKYDKLIIADLCDKAQFKAGLKEHQQGKTDFPTFVSLAAKVGVEEWVVRVDEMTCTYYDKTGNEILVEEIPQ